MTNKTNHILFVSGMSIVFNQTSNINYTGFVKDIWEFNQIAPCPEYLGQYVTGNNGFGFHRKSYVPWFWLWWDRTLWKRNIIWSIQKSLPLLWSIKLYNVNDSNAKNRTLLVCPVLAPSDSLCHMSQATVWAPDPFCWALHTSCALLIWNMPEKNLCVHRVKFNYSSRSLASSRPNQNPFAWTGHRMCRQNSYTANWVLPAGLRHVDKKFRHFSFASPLPSTWLLMY